MPSKETKSRMPWAWERGPASAIRPAAIARAPTLRHVRRLTSETKETNREDKRPPFPSPSMIIDPREGHPALARPGVRAVRVRRDLSLPSRYRLARRLADRHDNQRDRTGPGGERSARLHHGHQRLHLHAYAQGHLRYFRTGCLATQRRRAAQSRPQG